MKIGLDFDGVFCDAGKLLSEGAKRLFSIDLPEDKTSEQVAVKEGFLSQEEFVKLKQFVFGNSGGGLELSPVLNASNACRALIDKGHHLEIVTKRNESLENVRGFCSGLGLSIPMTGMSPNQPKSTVADGFDVFLDDSPSILQELKKTISNLFLFSWSYNTSIDCPDFIRVFSWEDFIQKIG